MATEENNITLTMQDVDVVRKVNPVFNDQLLIAAVSRIRAESIQCTEDEED